MGAAVAESTRGWYCGVGDACTLLDLTFENVASQIKFRCVQMIFQIYLERHTSTLVSLFIGFRHVKRVV